MPDKSLGEKPKESTIKPQRNQNSLRVILYDKSEKRLSPEDMHGFGDYECPLRKTMMPIGKKIKSQYIGDTPKD
jgi:hypothetical protein